jgi:hypothetical protein
MVFVIRREGVNRFTDLLYIRLLFVYQKLREIHVATSIAVEIVMYVTEETRRGQFQRIVPIRCP